MTYLIIAAVLFAAAVAVGFLWYHIIHSTGRFHDGEDE